MSFVRSVLQPGETVRFETNLHWIIFLPGIALVVFSGVLYWIGTGPNAWFIWSWLALFVLACAAVVLFAAWFRQWTTEIAVTSRRIIYKRGFVWRQTKEIALDKVESVDVDQSILGRLLDYGTIRAHGTGQAIEELRMIRTPIAFRNHVTAE
jgi:uncharacterized membrane protein YdbT with pleckstrin-like domain